jgi:quercetin dioxygenase-like cupin family protein
MSPVTFAEFEAQTRTQGFDEVLERVWPAGCEVPTHTHAFEVNALVVQGEMWLTCGSETRHLLPGDRFELAMDAPHAERYGAEGATFWVARKNASV